MNRPSGYVDINQLQAETTLESAAAKCGVTLDVKGSGREVRIDCPFHCPGDHCGRKEVAVNVENPQKVFMCHAYECKFRGNLLTLMHGWLTGSKRTGDKLKGDEFQRVRKVLTGEVGVTATPKPAAIPTQKSDSPTPAPKRNIPLIDSAEPHVRELHNIDEKFVVDVAVMNPAAAAYVRQHPCLSPASMKKWHCGYLPNDGGGDKRGWSLRGGVVYPVLSEDGKVLAWAGRDVNYDEKEREFSRLSPAERTGKDPPMKHRFPKGFHRGLELFGQHSPRLREPGYREFITRHGIIVVEGFNDVIGLDNFGSVLRDGVFWGTLQRTVLFTVATVGLTMVVGTLLALLLVRVSRVVRVLLTTGLVLVWSMPVVVAVQVWYWMTNFHNGVLNHIFTELRLGDFFQHDWYATTFSKLAMVTLLIVWVVLGNAAAAALSSGGPVYYGRLAALPDPFAPLMEYLRAANDIVPIWAVTTQDYIWDIYANGTFDLGSGISASSCSSAPGMPSAGVR